MSLLEKALQLAVKGHKGQTDRAGVPYVFHPIRIMCRMETEDQKIVALLHDLVEDTDYTLEDLKKEGFPERIVRAVDCLTKREDEAYQELVNRAKKNPIAIHVKIGDLEDNMDVRRNPKLTPKALERFKKYRSAWEELTAARANQKTKGAG